MEYVHKNVETIAIPPSPPPPSKKKKKEKEATIFQISNAEKVEGQTYISTKMS
jgi:hypothetical protein